MTNFKWNDDAFRQIEEEARRKLQHKVDNMAQDAVRSVRDEYAGESADEVLAKLHDRIAAAGFEPNDTNLRSFAQDIVDGTLTG